MYDVVPGALQRLRKADIVSMAGLMVASLGQEYYRKGAIHTTKRQGALLSGIVELTNTTLNQTASTTNSTLETQQAINSVPGSYFTEVELRDRISCNVTCSCMQPDVQSGVVCSHAAALLYYWLAHPLDFQVAPHTLASPVPLPFEQELAKSAVENDDVVMETKKSHTPIQRARLQPRQASLPSSNTTEILAQSGLGELRTIARAYEIPTNGLSKQELSGSIVNILKQPEAIRGVVASLEKQQRQLLAALTLAGGSMNDEDLRGLFERFSLGGPGQLHNMLHILQSKALIVRATFNNSMQQRFGIGLSGSTLDVSWYVPLEVRAALHVTLPITPFTIEIGSGKDAASPKVQQVEPYSLLADLLLVARALDGKRLESEVKGKEDSSSTASMGLYLHSLLVEGSIAITPLQGMPSMSLLKSLQTAVPRPLPFLRYAFRILRLADILYKDEAGTSRMHLLPNAAELLLGPSRTEVAYELFTHWLNQLTYEELFELQEDGLHLRCSATPLNQPALRSGELEIENREARQTLVALIAQAPRGQWINFSAFARFVYRLNPAFLQRRQRQFSSPHWWIEQEEGRPLHPTQLSSWMRAEGRYLAKLLQGSLYWWGFCDVVLSAGERLLAFKLTPLADTFIGTQFITPSTNVLQILPAALSTLDISESGELLIPSASANWPLIELIERFAEVKAVHAAKLCYCLTPKSLSEAFKRGESSTAL